MDELVGFIFRNYYQISSYPLPPSLRFYPFNGFSIRRQVNEFYLTLIIRAVTDRFLIKLIELHVIFLTKRDRHKTNSSNKDPHRVSPLISDTVT